MVITDGVFSMDGDIAKLPEIVEIAEEFDIITYVMMHMVLVCLEKALEQ